MTFDVNMWNGANRKLTTDQKSLLKQHAFAVFEDTDLKARLDALKADLGAELSEWIQATTADAMPYYRKYNGASKSSNIAISTSLPVESLVSNKPLKQPDQDGHFLTNCHYQQLPRLEPAFLENRFDEGKVFLVDFPETICVPGHGFSRISHSLRSHSLKDLVKAGKIWELWCFSSLEDVPIPASIKKQIQGVVAAYHELCASNRRMRLEMHSFISRQAKISDIIEEWPEAQDIAHLLFEKKEPEPGSTKLSAAKKNMAARGVIPAGAAA